MYIIFKHKNKTIYTDYLKRSAAIYFGLLPAQVRCLAYEAAVHINIPTPDSWTKTKKPALIGLSRL